MVFNCEALWGQTGQVTGAGVDVKYLLALHALKVVMVVMPRNFVAGVFTRQLDFFERAIFGQAFQVSLNGGNA
jgi:hypothetical protein